MSFSELTAEQQAFAEYPNEIFVKACPGAGKTHTVLARIHVIASDLPPRKGIALLSFTNSAIEEFKARSAPLNMGAIFKHPGFIGTFDSFIRTFLFPSTAIYPGVKTQVVDSWDTLDAEIRLTGHRAHAWGVSLDCFDPIYPKNIPYESMAHVDSNRQQYEQAAARYRDALNRKGYYSLDQARQIVLERLRNPDIGNALGKALSARFYEIIVDEAQDCNPVDLEILSWLRSHGVRVTMVCDPDQSIYAFRGGDQSVLEEFSDTYGENIKTISGNFRCSPPICSLAASLRSAGSPDEAVGKTQNVQHPIVVIPYEGQISPEIGSRFMACLSSKEDAETLLEECIILAHRRDTAQKSSGGFTAPPTGKSRVERVAFAVKEFWTPESTKTVRRTAVNIVEKMILDYMGLREENDSVESTVETHSINPRILRRQAVSLLMSLSKAIPDTDEAKNEWIENLRSSVDALGLPTKPNQSIRRFFATPRNTNWNQYLRSEEDESGIPYATIHQAKGREYSAVCVVIPPDRGRNTRTTDLITAWQSRTILEPKNVIYVGVTRAQFLTAIAIPAANLQQLVTILKNAEVPHEIVEA